MARRVREALHRCKAIIRYGVGYDTNDVEAATDNSIIVVNIPAPEWCAEEVSNHAIALLLACAKKLAFFNDSIKQGRWAECKRAQAPMVSIHGQTLGLVGCGGIGRVTGRKAQCFGLKVLGYDPYVDKSRAKEYGITLVSLPELLKESDFVSVHTLLNKETWHLMKEKEVRQMKPTAYFINTARGSVVDEPALIKALQEKWIAGAGLDALRRKVTSRHHSHLALIALSCALRGDARVLGQSHVYYAPLRRWHRLQRYGLPIGDNSRRNPVSHGLQRTGAPLLVTLNVHNDEGVVPLHRVEQKVYQKL